MAAAASQGWTLSKAVGEIYDAALEPSHWQEVLPRMCASLGSPRGILGLAMAGSEAVTLEITHELEPALVARWRSEYASFDPWAENVGRKLPAGATFHGADERCFPRIRASGVYNDIYRPAGVHDVITTVTSLNFGTQLPLGLPRTPRARVRA